MSKLNLLIGTGKDQNHRLEDVTQGTTPEGLAHLESVLEAREKDRGQALRGTVGRHVHRTKGHEGQGKSISYISVLIFL